MRCFAIDGTERYKEELNQICFSLYLFRWYSEKSPVDELIFGVVAVYIKQKFLRRFFTVHSSASTNK